MGGSPACFRNDLNLKTDTQVQKGGGGGVPRHHGVCNTKKSRVRNGFGDRYTGFIGLVVGTNTGMETLSIQFYGTDLNSSLHVCSPSCRSHCAAPLSRTILFRAELSVYQYCRLSSGAAENFGQLINAGPRSRIRPCDIAQGMPLERIATKFDLETFQSPVVLKTMAENPIIQIQMPKWSSFWESIRGFTMTG